MHSATALHVLGDPILFRRIVAWTTGWPGSVAYELLPALSPNASRLRQTAASTTDALLRVADLHLLEVASKARWRNSRGELIGFELLDVAQAIKSCNVHAVRFALDHSKPDAIAFFSYWTNALRYSNGQCDVLDVVKEYSPPITFWRGHYDSLTHGLATDDRLNEIRHVAVARWIIKHYGSDCLPSNLMGIALRRGCLGLYYFLRNMRGQVDDSHLVTPSVLTPTHLAIHSLVERCRAGGAISHGEQLLRLATKTEDAEFIELLLHDWSSYCSKEVVNKASEALRQLTMSAQSMRQAGTFAVSTKGGPAKYPWQRRRYDDRVCYLFPHLL